MDIVTTNLILTGVAAALAGLVRGFAGFGTAMIFMPIVVGIRSPEHALVLMFLISFPSQIPFILPALRRCNWREVLPLASGAAVMLPLGVALILSLPPTIIRVTISLLVLGFTITMAIGWRYTKRPSAPQTVAIGGVAGLAGGFAGLYGPAIVLFWLGGQNTSASVRANLFAFFGAVSLVEVATFTANDMITRPLLCDALWLIPLHLASMWLGARTFRFASEQTFRRVALLLCTIAALSGLKDVV